MSILPLRLRLLHHRGFTLTVEWLRKKKLSYFSSSCHHVTVTFHSGPCLRLEEVLRKEIASGHILYRIHLLSCYCFAFASSEGLAILPWQRGGRVAPIACLCLPCSWYLRYNDKQKARRYWIHHIPPNRSILAGLALQQIKHNSTLVLQKPSIL